MFIGTSSKPKHLSKQSALPSNTPSPAPHLQGHHCQEPPPSSSVAGHRLLVLLIGYTIFLLQPYLQPQLTTTTTTSSSSSSHKSAPKTSHRHLSLHSTFLAFPLILLLLAPSTGAGLLGFPRRALASANVAAASAALAAILSYVWALFFLAKF